MTRVRGQDRGSETMFSYVSAEQRVPKEHPLRAIRALVDDVFRDMSREFVEQRVAEALPLPLSWDFTSPRGIIEGTGGVPLELHLFRGSRSSQSVDRRRLLES
jgi:hypothetical protein